MRFSKPFSKRSLLSIFKVLSVALPVQPLYAPSLPDAMIVRQSRHAKFFGRFLAHFWSALKFPSRTTARQSAP
ncbi:hypothetical protein BN2476_250166 [Paraburkholderia piptadeniae]|uniref:Uncharacterized protein n=1 Tax=Paraburkholderia piptadeniae TaxID=1701573 RepID=A0A1N7S0R5_9BURK|nr:hypothetical protein BN2476_250166 [Paraburkholderia piptadeniae]